jgi:hypothetical protein
MKPYRNKKIARAINEHCVCCITGAPNPDPHHIIGHGYSGMGTKASDCYQMALSHEMHMELHNKGWKAFEAKYGRSQQGMVAETLARLHSIGAINVADLPLEDWVFDEMEVLTYE